MKGARSGRGGSRFVAYRQRSIHVSGERNTAIRSVQPEDILSSAPQAGGNPTAENGPDANAPGASGQGVLPDDLLVALYGALEKKAEEFRIFDLRGVTSLTEFFVICSGSNQRQNQAISDEIYRLLKDKRQRPPLGVEGYEKADWILMDYGDFIVHVLSGQARKYYELERLWRQARVCELPPDVEVQARQLLGLDTPTATPDADPAQQ
jgi:ribosome-associated protein